MGKYNIYAVAYGVDPKTKEPVQNVKFTSWNDCKPYIAGIDGAKYKGFLTDDEADAWLEATIAKLAEEKTETVEEPKHECKCASKYSDDFKKVCMKLGVSPEEITTRLQDDFVKQMQYIAKCHTETKS